MSDYFLKLHVEKPDTTYTDPVTGEQTPSSQEHVWYEVVMPADINRDEPLPERTSYAINAHAPRMGKATSLAALHNNMDLSPCQKSPSSVAIS